MLNFVSVIAKFIAIDHSRCDTVLYRHSIEIINAYDPAKGRYDQLFPYGLVFLLLWLSAVFIAAGLNLISERTDSKQIIFRVVLPLFILVGLVLLRVSVDSMVQYIAVCSSILAGHVPHAVGWGPGLSGDRYGALAGLSCALVGVVAFALASGREFRDRAVKLAVRWICLLFTACGLVLAAMNV